MRSAHASLLALLLAALPARGAATAPSLDQAELAQTKALLDLAAAEEASGRLLDASRHLHEVLAELEARLARADTPPDKRKLFEAELAQAKQRQASVFARIARVRISAPDGARLAVNRKPLPDRAPWPKPLELLPGSYELSATVGTRSESVRVELAPGSEQSLDLGNTLTGPSPTRLHDTTPSSFTEPSFWTPGRTVAAGLGVAALAAAGLGLGFGLSARSSQDSAQASSNTIGPYSCVVGGFDARCNEVRDQADTWTSHATLSNVFWITSGALAAASIVLLLTTGPSSKPSKAARLFPSFVTRYEF